MFRTITVNEHIDTRNVWYSECICMCANAQIYLKHFDEMFDVSRLNCTLAVDKSKINEII